MTIVPPSDNFQDTEEKADVKRKLREQRIPSKVRKLYDPPPLLITESADDFWEFVLGVSVAHNPGTEMQWIWVYDLAILLLKKNRLDRILASLMAGGFKNIAQQEDLTQTSTLATWENLIAGFAEAAETAEAAAKAANALATTTAAAAEAAKVAGTPDLEVKITAATEAAAAAAIATKKATAARALATENATELDAIKREILKNSPADSQKRAHSPERLGAAFQACSDDYAITGDAIAQLAKQIRAHFKNKDFYWVILGP